jgi:hypothetical protein
MRRAIVVDREDNVVTIARFGPRKLPELTMRKNKLVGDVVVATGAGDLPLDVLAGALLEAAESNDNTKLVAWALRGAAFFDGGERSAP